MNAGAQICPYTGLRPFTEDESLYFKGRDEHIDQATKQLEKNKFIMLTGASGDGKSSLVYAGIVPNARAGFLKSQYTNWVVAEFRPERNPLGNLSRAVAKQLGIAQEQTVRTELGHGFSSLVDIYKASKFYQDVNDPEWKALSDDEKTKRKRGAANLVIVADQFEEFFTNPENFQKGVPSQDASLAVNLLLETARISLDEKLPIYVIITMRSDFIGQCSSFRGLPEAIGFSQFFVPRLNRAQLQEVIEEPAVLSGNKISRRLTERLIHDMTEGTDQLPILQHALNQIWKMADEGNSEMDLVHYAMVGGMPGADLPGQNVGRFTEWFNKQPEKIRACYDDPDLQNVLNTHANKLYNLAPDYLKEKFGEDLSLQDVQMVIEVAFKCLTKIDSGRAVRNRMTLGEITAIVNRQNLGSKTIGRILDIFREPGNTLVRPFLEDVAELDANSVLDITHESLIRNWDNLDRWVKEEFANYTIYLDFSQQLNRWVDSGKSNAFLLYIGPLTYFEAWYNKTQPNVTWISRYLGEGMDRAQKELKAREILQNIREFLPRSARKHMITRTVMKYGPRRIAVALAVIAFLTLSSWSVKKYFDRQDAAVLEEIQDRSVPLLNNPRVAMVQKASLVIEEIRLGVVSLPGVIASIADPITKVEVANGVALELVTHGFTEPAGLISQSMVLTDSLLDTYPVPYDDPQRLARHLNYIREWTVTTGLAYFYDPSEKLMALQNKNGKRCARLVLDILEKQPKGFSDVLNFTHALETAVNFNGFTQDELRRAIQALSPFENGTRGEWVQKTFRKGSYLARYQNYAHNFSGLYQDLAYLYAADGQLDRVLQCTDSLLKYNDQYFERDYSLMLENASNIASVFYRSNHRELLDAFVGRYCSRKGQSRLDFYYRLIGRMHPYNLARSASNQFFFRPNQNLNLQYNEQGEVAFFYDRFRDVIQQSPSEDERNFYLALSCKDQGILTVWYAQVLNKEYNREEVNTLFSRGIDHFNKVSQRYRSLPMEGVSQNPAGSAATVGSREGVFLFPDIIFPFVPLGVREFHFYYTSPSFLEYTIDQGFFDEFYGNDQSSISAWLRDYHVHANGQMLFMRSPASLEMLSKLDSALARTQASSNLDVTLLDLHMGEYAFKNGDQQLAMKYYDRLRSDRLVGNFNFRLFRDYNHSNLLGMVSNALWCYITNRREADAYKLVTSFRHPANRSSIYALAAHRMVGKVDAAVVRQLLDSANREMQRVENANSRQPNRSRIGIALIENAPTPASVQRAKELIRNLPIKYTLLMTYSRAMAHQGQVFSAAQIIPDNISDLDLIDFYWNIANGVVDRAPVTPEWQRFESNPWFVTDIEFTPYVDERN